MKFWPRYCKNTAWKSFLKLTFFVYYWIKNSNTKEPSAVLKSTHEHSRAPMSPHEHSWAVMSTFKYGANALWVVWGPWRNTHECLLTLMSAVCAMTPGSWVLMVAYNAHECSRVALGPREHMATIMSAFKHSWPHISNQEHSLTWPHGTNSTHECR